MSLPSEQSANALVTGQDGAWLQVLLHAGARAFLVGAGAAAVGVPSKYWVKTAIGGTLAIEAFVLAYAYWTRNQQ